MKRLYFLFLVISHCVARGQEHTLGYYINAAAGNSPLLADLRNQAQSSSLDSQLLHASRRVQVNGISNNFYAPVIAGAGYDQIITNGAQVSALVQANRTIVSSSNLAAQYETIRLARDAAGNSGAIAERDLRKNVTMQYVTAYGDLKAWEFSIEIFELLSNQESLLKRLTQSGIYKQSDYLTFYVSFQQQQLITRQAELQFKNDFAILNYLCGVVDTASVKLAAPDLQPGNWPDIFATPYYRKYTIDSLDLLNQQKTLYYSYKPKLNIYTDGGYNSSLMYLPYRNFGLSAGLNLTVPIYDGKQRKLKYQKIGIAENTRQHYRDFFVSQYRQQVAQLAQQLASTNALVSDIEKQIKYSGTLIDVNRKLLETGEVRISDLILAINVFLNARNLLNQNYVNRMQIINQINYWTTL